jgi:NRAMP (natural resistance-associated macrophage protein)-like metal ion transporter
MTARKNLTAKNAETGKGHNLLTRSFAVLGPELITGAAHDDPSGISTYSVAGGAYGYGTLWIALLTFPLMAAIQLMCARLGMVTGRGLAAAVRIHYPRWVLWGACHLTPPLILLVILLTSSQKVMGMRVNSPPLRYLGWATFGIMTAAAVGMLITS